LDRLINGCWFLNYIMKPHADFDTQHNSRDDHIQVGVEFRVTCYACV